MNNIAVILMASPGGKSGGWESILPLALIMVVFYVFMILPQVRKTKKQKGFRELLKKGDKVVLIAGIHGKITEVGETTYVIELEDQTKMKIEKAAISMESTIAVYPKPAEDKK